MDTVLPVRALTSLLNLKKNVFSLKMNSEGRHTCWRQESDLVGCWTSSAACDTTSIQEAGS